MNNKLVVVSFLAAAITGGATTGGASAADAAVSEPAPEASVPYYDWSGFYAGVHAGYGWAKSETDDLFAYDLGPEDWLGACRPATIASSQTIGWSVSKPTFRSGSWTTTAS